MVVSSSTPARLPSEPIMFQLSIILLISHWNQKKRAKTWGETPRQMGYSSPFRCEIKSIIDMVYFIGSDGRTGWLYDHFIDTCATQIS